MKITELGNLSVGIPLFRIKKSFSQSDTVYASYGQEELEADLTGKKLTTQPKEIRTANSVKILNEGDVIFSLVSGEAAIVDGRHAGYLYSQNYVVISPVKKIDAGYLVYLLNEDQNIKKQFWRNLQGSIVMKYTIQQLREIDIKRLPSLDKQQAIGKIYLKQLRIQTLKRRMAHNETLLRFAQLKEIN